MGFRRLALLVNKSKKVPVKEKPGFEFSGALLEDTNTFWDVVIKYSETPEVRILPNTGIMRYFGSCTSIG